MPSQVEEKLVITFQSVNFAMQGEKKFEDNNLDLKIIPTPREISSSCGLSILTSLDYLGKIRQIEKEGMKVANYWKYKKKEDGTKEAILIEE